MASEPRLKVHGYGEFRGQVYCGVIWMPTLKVSVSVEDWDCVNCIAKRKRQLAYEAKQAKEVVAAK